MLPVVAQGSWEAAAAALHHCSLGTGPEHALQDCSCCMRRAVVHFLWQVLGHYPRNAQSRTAGLPGWLLHRMQRSAADAVLLLSVMVMSSAAVLRGLRLGMVPAACLHLLHCRQLLLQSRLGHL